MGDEIVVFWAAADDEICVVSDVVCGSMAVKIGATRASVDEMVVVLDVGAVFGVVCASDDEMGVVIDIVRVLVELGASVVDPVTDGG